MISSNLKEHLHKFLLVSFVASSTLLLAPENMSESLNLTIVQNNFGSFISLIWLLTFCYFVIATGDYALGRCQTKFAERKSIQKAKQKTSCLDHEERALLREFFLQRTRVLWLPTNQEAVKRLESGCILQRQISKDPTAELQKFCIAPTAYQFITSNKLRLPITDLTEDDIRYFKSERPIYIKEQLRRQWRDQMKLQRHQVA